MSDTHDINKVRNNRLIENPPAYAIMRAHQITVHSINTYFFFGFSFSLFILKIIMQ